MLGLLAPLLQKQGVDPNVLLAMKGNNGFGGEGGWHFNKKMCEWAVAQMKKNGKRIKAMSSESVEELLRKHDVELENNIGHDACYIANMCVADFYGSSIMDEKSLAKFVKDYVDDEDQQDGFIFNRFYADCAHNGVGIPWDEIL